jgi:hypothetical protein
MPGFSALFANRASGNSTSLPRKAAAESVFFSGGLIHAYQKTMVMHLYLFALYQGFARESGSGAASHPGPNDSK